MNQRFRIVLLQANGTHGLPWDQVPLGWNPPWGGLEGVSVSVEGEAGRFHIIGSRGNPNIYYNHGGTNEQ